jgi:hypothetical protein
MLAAKSCLQSKKGMAVMELIPIMIIIVVLFNFSLGFFGAIHTGILNSMAARNYAFETFRHRSNLTYLRSADGVATTYASQNMRLHASVSLKGDHDHFIATGRPIDFLTNSSSIYKPIEGTGSKDLHNKQIHSIVTDGKRITDGNGGVAPIWVRPQYGICLNSKCGTN